MKLRMVLCVLVTGVLCAVAQGAVVSNIDVTLGHSWTWGWADDGNYNLVPGPDNIDFFGVKVVSGSALEGPSPIALAGWTSWLNGNGTAGAAGPVLVPNFNIYITQVDPLQTTKIDVAAFSGGSLVGAIELSSDNPVGTWHFIDWTPAQSDFVPEPASLIIWSLFGLGSMFGVRVWRQRKIAVPASRQPWSDENRMAISQIIERGLHQ
jgi:hypothetical protein